MLMLSKIGKDRRGVSLIVAYAILITIAIALSVLVYNWLKFYVDETPDVSCPEDVKIVIKDYNCDIVNRLNISLQNKGLFTIDGFFLRVNNRVGAENGFYILNQSGSQLKPGESEDYFFRSDVDVSSEPISGGLTFVDVQPYVLEKGKKVLCEGLASLKLEGC